jgi:hypothetical protein
MKGFVLSLLLVLSFSGCDALSSSDDIAAKTALSGIWYVEFRDPSERSIKYLVDLTQPDTFTAKQRIEGDQAEESSSGRWYVTERLFKLHTNEIAGKKLGTLESSYLTCKLSQVGENEFVCEIGDNRLKLTFRRVKSGFKLS